MMALGPGLWIVVRVAVRSCGLGEGGAVRTE